MILDEFGNEFSTTKKDPQQEKDTAEIQGIQTDEDWKAQAQKELEALDEKSQKTAAEKQKAPEATFLNFLAGLEMQAAMAMGLMQHPDHPQATPDMGTAKYLVDTLGMLAEKTEGNLTDEESNHLKDVLTQFRMAYVQLAQDPVSPTPQPKPEVLP